MLVLGLTVLLACMWLVYTSRRTDKRVDELSSRLTGHVFDVDQRLEEFASQVARTYDLQERMAADWSSVYANTQHAWDEQAKKITDEVTAKVTLGSIAKPRVRR